MHVNRYDYDVIVKVFQLTLRGKKKYFLCVFIFELKLRYELNRVQCLEFLKQNCCMKKTTKTHLSRLSLILFTFKSFNIG